MSNSTLAAIDGFAKLGLRLNDNQVAVAIAGAVSGPSTPRVMGNLARFTRVPTGGACMLPSLKTLENNLPFIVINDGATTMSVYAYSDGLAGNPNGESVNGTLSVLGTTGGRLTIATGGFAILVPEGLQRPTGGAPTANLLNWTGAAVAPS